MNTMSLFFNLIRTNIKRLKSYIPQLLFAVVILVLVCGGALRIISDRLYTTKEIQQVCIAVYLPEDEDIKYNKLALRMIDNAESVSELAYIQLVDTIDEGYAMIDSGEALFFIIVPEYFFSGIMDSTNPELTIVVEDFDNLYTYAGYELLSSYASYLTYAQAGIYTALDTIREHSDLPDDEEYVLENTNITFLERTLNRSKYVEAVEAKDAGEFPLAKHYIGAITFLVLLFSGFVISSFLQARNNGLYTALYTHGISPIHIFFSDYVSVCAAIYIAYLPCVIAVWIYNQSINLQALYYSFAAILIIAFIITLVNCCCRTTFAANITLFIVTLIIAYVGGGILPEAFLPNIIHRISSFLPGKYVISLLCKGFFL